MECVFPGSSNEQSRAWAGVKAWPTLSSGLQEASYQPGQS
jgi:hypothetical protein